jgi:bacterioferritin (cytochrome b1)
VWYHNKYSVEALTEKVQKLEESHNSFNIQVIETNIRYNREHIDRLEQELKNKRDK